MKWAVVVFPGSNCDVDAHHAVRDVLNHSVDYVWHTTRDLSMYDAVIIPGGFSYGDYLRTGAVAALSPVMNGVREAADAGKPIIGICNGFQILCESGLLPGALTRNRNLHFECRPVHVRVEHDRSPWLSTFRPGQVLTIPIAHGEGRYFIDPERLTEIEARGQIALRYCGPNGELDDRFNPNGSVAHIAGVTNERGNVLGMMPHPERAVEALLGGEDGRLLLESVVHKVAKL